MQKMSFRQVRDIQEAVRLLSKGVFINANHVLMYIYTRNMAAYGNHFSGTSGGGCSL